MVANDLCIKAKANCCSVKQSSFSGLVCSGLHNISDAQELSGRIFDARPGVAVLSLEGFTALCP